MTLKNLILIDTLCVQYHVEKSFFNSLNEIGLIEITEKEELFYIHENTIKSVEKMIRLHNELELNLQGIDVVFNLLEKIDQLNEELLSVKNRLGLYEEE